MAELLVGKVSGQAMIVAILQLRDGRCLTKSEGKE